MGSANANRIRQIELKNFRNYPELRLNLDKGLVFLTGDNGAGKTSILEAIFLLSYLRSFRFSSDKELVHWGNTFYSVKARCESYASSMELFLAYGITPGGEQKIPMRRLQVNRDKVQKVSAFLGKFKTVVFTPADIGIIENGPDERRRFLDMLLSAVYPSYLESLQRYTRTLRSRNVLLKGTNTKDLNFLSALDTELALYGSQLLKHRLDFMDIFEKPFTEYVKTISGGKDSWLTRYQATIPEGFTQEEYLKKLTAQRDKDFSLRQTTTGIHRDRLLFHSQPGNIEIRLAASQGQKRTAALALKMAQFTITRKVSGQTPVLLVDDVLNELDQGRRAYFVEFLKDIGQAIFTTTDLSGMTDFLRQTSAGQIAQFHISQSEKGPLVREITL